MSVDPHTIRRIAHLARVKLDAADVERMQGELNAILSFVEDLNTVDVEGVEPMSSVIPSVMTLRPDAVTEGGQAAVVVANAPVTEDGFFLVPKVVE